MDFSKAFDKVDHGILLHKHKDLGITSKHGIWFFHFLTNRTHYVRLPSGLSQNSPVLSGVPQGTVLGPLLYILSAYSLFSDRVGLPLHNLHIPSPFTSIMDIFFVDLKFGHVRFYTL